MDAKTQFKFSKAEYSKFKKYGSNHVLDLGIWNEHDMMQAETCMSFNC